MPKGKKPTKSSIIACSKRRKQMNDVPFLPEEIIINILRRLPANFLHNKARYVCKTWANILRDGIFIKSLLLHSNSALYIQDNLHPAFVRFLDTKKEKLNVRYSDFRFPGKILGSSGGILLIYKSGKHVRGDYGSLYAANHITMQVVKLPYPPATHKFNYNCGTIAYIPYTGELKVVCYSYESNDWYPYILTMGKDLSWRKFSNKYCGFGKSISAGRVVYWTNLSWHSDCNILAMDLRDETTHYLEVPKELSDGAHWLHRMERNLCCMIWKLPGVLEVWMLKDLHQREWAIVNRIISVNSFRGIRNGDPIAWLDNNQILIIKVDRSFRSYNLNTGKWSFIKCIDASHHEITVHTNSLVSL